MRLLPNPRQDDNIPEVDAIAPRKLHTVSLSDIGSRKTLKSLSGIETQLCQDDLTTTPPENY